LYATQIEAARLRTADKTGFLMVPVIALPDGGYRCSGRTGVQEVCNSSNVHAWTQPVYQAFNP
jgi:hypothetical protein